MNKMKVEKSSNGFLIRRNKVDFFEGVLVYELRTAKSREGLLLSITVKLGEDSSSCLFAARIRDVMNFYKSIVKNTVTPCTLGDVAEDFKNQKILDAINR